jgi:hypothetical protein
MTLELLKAHTHAGVLYAQGARLDVDSLTARWLIEHGVAQALADKAPRNPTSSSSQGE